ncbi:MAG: hypothetical protein K0R54_5657 [Clostridiaceae bacterium]|jgi:hypothetical protein|nr:hypothetical protein [Clostridiaceae bacterium]
MEVFNIISGICSIIGLAVTIFATSKVVKISQHISSKQNAIEKNKMRDNNTIVGGNFNGTPHKR